MKVRIPKPESNGACSESCMFHRSDEIGETWCDLDHESFVTRQWTSINGKRSVYRVMVPGPDCPGPGKYRLVRVGEDENEKGGE